MTSQMRQREATALRKETKQLKLQFKVVNIFANGKYARLILQQQLS